MRIGDEARWDEKITAESEAVGLKEGDEGEVHCFAR